MLLLPSFGRRTCSRIKCTHDSLTYSWGSSCYALQMSTFIEGMRLDTRKPNNDSKSSLDSIISDHIKHGEFRHAVFLYQSIQDSTPQLREHTFVSLIKACALINDIEIGCRVHADIARRGLLETNLFVGNSLIDMYVKWGCLPRAVEVHHALSVCDVVTWTALIEGYAELGYDDGALNCFIRMQLECILPNAITFICTLKACGTIGAVGKGKELHIMALANGLLDQDPVVGNALLAMYAKCGMLTNAQELFDCLFLKNIVSWNTIISGYIQHEDWKEALFYFEQMHMEGISANDVTLLCILNACGCIGATRKGTQVYAVILSQNLLEKDLVLGNALVDMLAKFGILARAQEVFNLLPFRDVVTWTTLIVGYTQHQDCEESLCLFKRMQLEGVTPNAVTYACCLKACGSIGALVEANEIHCEVARNGVLARYVIVGNALVDVYIKCGLPAKAQEVLDNLQVRDVVSWNTLIAGYVQHEWSTEALVCYRKMHHDGMLPNALTFVITLNGCGNLGAADTGKEIHDEIMRRGLLKGQPMVGTALLDMYAKCGMLLRAESVFSELHIRDCVAWNSLVTGYAQLGDVKSVLHAISRMNAEGNTPDLITFLNILNACSHAGLVDEGESYFVATCDEYGLTPALDHYVCILDLLSRAGQLERAMELMKDMPFHPNNVMTLIVLGACRKWGNVELARQAFEEALQVDEREAAAYICMFNIYADVHPYL